MTGAAWLSSARAVRRSIKLGNERNPYPVLYLSQETAQPQFLEIFPETGAGRKAGMTPNPHGP